MRRLTRPSWERGATAVLVAILTVALFGFTAIAVDIGAVWWDRKQVQNGADAGALAIAQACAASESSCDSPNSAAQNYAIKNKTDASASATALVDKTAGTVTVTASTTRQHWFAPVLGINETNIGATAKATWGKPKSGASLPMTLSWCDWNSQTGLDSGYVPPASGGVIELPLIGFKNKDPKCNRGAHNEIPGGFGFLNDLDCQATVTVDGTTTGYTGNTTKGDCTDEDWLKLRNATVLLPLFDQAVRDDAACDPAVKQCSVTYTITGFAAIHVTGYCLPTSSGGHLGWPEKCNASKYGITGEFVNYASLAEGLATGSVSEHFGASIVTLID